MSKGPHTIFDLTDASLIGREAIASIVDVLNRLHDQNYEEDVIDRGRIPIRVVAALCSPEEYTPGTVARLTGCIDTHADTFCTMLAASGQWTGETGYEKLRTYLISVMIEGEHPRAHATRLGIDPLEYNSLNHLLNLETYWEDTRLGRTMLAALGGASRRKIRKVSGCGPLSAWRWQAWARNLRNAFPQQ